MNEKRRDLLYIVILLLVGLGIFLYTADGAGSAYTTSGAWQVRPGVNGYISTNEPKNKSTVRAKSEKDLQKNK